MNQMTKRLTRHWVAASIILAAFANPSAGQVLSHKNSLGIFLRPSFTKGLNSNNTGLSDPNYLTGGLGVYDLIRIRDTPAKVPFYFVKAELGLSNRTGLFDVQGFGPVRISSNVVDLSIVLPLSVEISETLRANAGIGGSLGYTSSSKVESAVGTPPLVAVSTWRPGLILDVGFIVDAKSTATFGFRTLLESGDYPYSELGFYLGFGFPAKNR